jgi:hypothetical protein
MLTLRKYSGGFGYMAGTKQLRRVGANHAAI